MIKLYITAIETKGNGSAVTLFEDFLVAYGDRESISIDADYEFNLNNKVFKKIEEVEKINNQVASPF